MTRKIIVLLLLFTLTLFHLEAQNNSREKYIKKFHKIAIKEMKRAGIPASIKLAQGILESNAGKSGLATKANNHFGMKCGSQWKGKTYYLKDDDYNDQGELIKSCFRVYSRAEESYVAHSEFLRDPRKRYRYGDLFRLNPRDYKAWARGLKKAGYATSKTYAEKLIRIIETYELDRFDRGVVLEDQEDNTNDNPVFDDNNDEINFENEGDDIEDSGILVLNNVKLLLAEKGDTPLEIAHRTGTSVKRILKYNEGLKSSNEKIKEDTRVYIQPKRYGYRGKKKYHRVKAGETLYYISQAYGIKLNRLRKRNRIPEGYEPAKGALIKLRGWKVSKRKSPRKVKANQKEQREKPSTTETTRPNSNVNNNGSKPSNNQNNNNTRPPANTTTTTPSTTTGNEEESFNPFEDELPKDNPVYHTVQKGDTLYKISKYYGTSVEQIRLFNNLRSNIINAGQRLRVK